MRRLRWYAAIVAGLVMLQGGVAGAQQPPAGAPGIVVEPGGVDPQVDDGQPPPGSPAVPANAAEVELPQPLNLRPHTGDSLPTTVSCHEFPATRTQRCTGPDGESVDLAATRAEGDAPE